jgi:hypothetical protein
LQNRDAAAPFVIAAVRDGTSQGGLPSMFKGA